MLFVIIVIIIIIIVVVVAAAAVVYTLWLIKIVHALYFIVITNILFHLRLVSFFCSYFIFSLVMEFCKIADRPKLLLFLIALRIHTQTNRAGQMLPGVYNLIYPACFRALNIVTPWLVLNVDFQASLKLFINELRSH